MALLGCVCSNRDSAGLNLLVRKVSLFCMGSAAWLIFSHAATAAAHTLLVSSSADKSNAVPLSDQIVSGNIYVFASPATEGAQVSFYLDDPSMSGPPNQVGPYVPNESGGNPDSGWPIAYDTTQLAAGNHTITVLVALSGGGTEIIQTTFTVAHGAATSGTGSATLSWLAPSTTADGNPLSLGSLAGYRIYHGTRANQLSLLVDLKDPTATTYTVSSLPPGTHYFAITVYDTSGAESAQAQIGSKTIR